MLPHGHVKAEENGNKYSKKLRESVLTRPDLQPLSSSGLTDPPASRAEIFQWRRGIVTTTFWIGEDATKNNPVPNHASSWDVKWAENFGGTDTPDRTARANFIPASFTPRQNPFYIALPYNDVQKGGHKPEASVVIPWFKEAFKAPGKSVLKGRWIAIHYKGRVAYAQWEDCGPFRTDHWQYVFGSERPKPNLNRGAGLDVSPAVRDYLGMLANSGVGSSAAMRRSKTTKPLRRRRSQTRTSFCGAIRQATVSSRRSSQNSRLNGTRRRSSSMARVTMQPITRQSSFFPIRSIQQNMSCSTAV